MFSAVGMDDMQDDNKRIVRRGAGCNTTHDFLGSREVETEEAVTNVSYVT